MQPKRQFIFDKATVDAQKAKWKSLGLQNYSFGYVISYMTPLDVDADVCVKNGTGVLDLKVQRIKKDDDQYDGLVKMYSDMYGSSIELYSIDDVFNFVEEIAIHRKQQFDSGEIIGYEMFVKYDEKGFPTSIKERRITNDPPPKPGVVGTFPPPSFWLGDFKIETSE